MNNLIPSIQQTLGELQSVLLLMDDKQFSTPLRIFSESSIGMHARHILEFYQCLLRQYHKKQVINYDKRKRDIMLQSNLEYFTLTVNNIIETLGTLDKDSLNQPLSITSDDEVETAMPINSSLGRELQYNLEHTIHHAAFIKIGVLSLLPDAALPKTFGVAPSTLRYQNS